MFAVLMYSNCRYVCIRRSSFLTEMSRERHEENTDSWCDEKFPSVQFSYSASFKETRQEVHEVPQILLGLSDSSVLIIPTELCTVNSVR